MIGTGINGSGRTYQAVVQSDTTEHKPGALKGILVMVAGSLTIVDSEGKTVVFVFPAAAAGGCYPYDLQWDIRKVMDTGTDIADASLIGYH